MDDDKSVSSIVHIYAHHDHNPDLTKAQGRIFFPPLQLLALLSVN